MNYVSSIVCAILSVAVSLLMAGFTNRRLRKSDAEEYSNVKPYAMSGWMYPLLAGILAVSGLCGGFVYEKAVRSVVVLQMLLCYLAVLGAAVVDLKLRIIPNVIPAILMCVRVALFGYELIFKDAPIDTIFSPLVGCLLCVIFMLVGNKLSKGGIGGGDIKLLAAIGLMCGATAVFFTLFYGLFACSIFAIFVTLTKKMTLKQSVPFGPFIYLGYIMVCLTAMY